MRTAVPVPMSHAVRLAGAALLSLSLLAAYGGGSGAGSTPAVPPPAPETGLRLLAGAVTAGGKVDANGAAARFQFPGAIASDGKGAIFAIDQIGRAVRKITTDGTVTSIAVQSPTTTYTDIAVDGKGEAYLVDYDGIGLWKLGSDADPIPVLPSAGAAYLSTYRARKAASGPDGALYIATEMAQDPNTECSRTGTCVKILRTVVVRMGADGKQTVLALGMEAAADAVTVKTPGGIALDRNGNVFLSDSEQNTIVRMTPAGVVTNFAGKAGVAGSADGTGGAATFSHPEHMAADAAGNVFVVDGGGLLVRKITPAGLVTTVAGTPGKNALVLGSSAASLSPVHGLAFDANGKLVLCVDNGLVLLLQP
jgi:DNA-binding beta-propeller fold protein YncE